MIYFTDPNRYHMAAASALTRLANMKAKTDRVTAMRALEQAEWHLDAIVEPTPENGFLAPQMQEWPI